MQANQSINFGMFFYDEIMLIKKDLNRVPADFMKYLEYLSYSRVEVAVDVVARRETTAAISCLCART